VNIVNYQIGPWLFTPAFCTISDADKNIELDPLLFKILYYLVKEHGRIISREELVEKVWQQSFVDDNAINRAISELRKQLSHPSHPAQLIKTHYRKGYSLVVSADLISEATTSESESNDDKSKVSDNVAQKSENKIESSPPKSQYKWLLVIILILLVGNIYYSYSVKNDILKSATDQKQTDDKPPQESSEENQSAQEKSQYVEAEVVGVTWNLGAEERPLVSPSKTYFAYSNRYENKIKSFVKRNSDLKEVQLVYKDYDIEVLSWQPKSDYLLAEITSTSAEDFCSYGLFDLTTFQSNPPYIEIKPCKKEGVSSAQLSADGRTLYYVALDEIRTGGEIVQYDVKSKKSSVIVSSGNSQYGVSTVKVSPNGDYLLYSWHEREKPKKLHLFDLKTREDKRLHEFGYPDIPIPYDWLPDSKHFAVQTAADFEVFDLSGQSIKKDKLPIREWVVDVSVENNKQMIISQHGGSKLELSQLSHPFEDNITIQTVISSDSYNYYPVQSRKSEQSLFFISNRTGGLEIWHSQDKKLTQVSNFGTKERKKMGQLALSPSEKFVLYIRGNKLSFYDIENNEENIIETKEGAPVSSYQWSEDEKSIFFDMTDNSVRQIWRYDLLTRKSKQITELGGQMLLKDELGDIYYINDGYLLGLHSEFKQKITIPIAPCWCSISKTSTALYSADNDNNFYRMNFSNGETAKVKLPFRYIGVQMVSDNIALFSKKTSLPTQLKRVSW